ncbi:MAG: hypothetical protein HZC40_21510 [Chloroflexi bacterium]|nr:hypothetical protein [Chloroflexota bacterium]
MGESVDLENTGHALLAFNEIDKAIQNYNHAIQIADEINFPQTQSYARWGLALAHLYAAQHKDLPGLGDLNHLNAARAAAEAACKFDVPQNNHNVAALLGIIALAQAAQNPKGLEDPSGLDDPSGFFRAAIAHADALLAQTPELYAALDAKGIALCGLAIINPKGLPDPSGF